MAVIVNGSEIMLTGTVGEMWFEDCFTHTDVIIALARLGDGEDVTVRLNSGGGIVTEGSAIHAAFARHGGKVTMVVEGAALSAASVIAMAGDEIVMSPGALMMVHDPRTETVGTAEEHEATLRTLEAVSTAMAHIYAARTGRSIEAVRADMRDETWMTGEDAVALGYATRSELPANDNQADREPTAFDYRLYAKAPQRLLAMAAARAWTARPPEGSAMQTPPDTQTPSPKETSPMENPTSMLAQINHEAALRAASDRAAQIAEICANAGAPTMAAALIRDGASVEDARKRVDASNDIRAAVDRARRICAAIDAAAADQFIAAGMSVETVSAKLFEMMTAAQSPAIASAHQSQPGSGIDQAAALAASIVSHVRPQQRSA